MGCLFFTAAYFAARSLARKGTARFVADRAMRRGLPLALYVFVISPFISSLILPSDGPRAGFVESYGDYLASGDFARSTGPLWFAEALLVMCVAYAVVRHVHTASAPSLLTHSIVWSAIAITAVAAFVLRLFFPLGGSVQNLQLGFFASYGVLFVLGVMVGESDSLDSLVEGVGRPWFARSLAWGLGAWAAVSGAILATDSADAISGGATWQAAAFASWEAFVSIGLSIGLVSFMGRKFPSHDRVTEFLSAHAFGIYVLHAPVLVAISVALANWDADALAKHAVVWPLAVAGSLAAAWLARQVPGLRAILQ